MPQDSSLDFKLVQRICLLQQALDQATDSLEELQQQVANHQMLQAHLAQTEEYSNVQQKIIHNLQQQLAAKDEWQHQVLDTLLAGIQRLVADQQQELERLRLRLYQSQTEVQDYLVRLKNDHQNLTHSPAPEPDPEVMIARSLIVGLSSQLHAARQHLQQLDHTLTRHQVTFARMQVHVQVQPDVSSRGDQASPAMSALADIGDAATVDLEHLEDPVALRAIIEAQRQKIAELNIELGKQFHHQTQLKSRCQEIAAERDWLKQQEGQIRQDPAQIQPQRLPQPEPFPPAKQISPWQAPSPQPHGSSRLRMNS